MSNVFFLDTEFIESGVSAPLQLISIAITSVDGRELYAISNEFDTSQCSEWVKKNVLPFLPPRDTTLWLARKEIATQIRKFIGQRSPVFWANYGCFDHVVLAQLFGSMMEYPDGWPYYTRDFRMLVELLGEEVLTVPVPTEHNALLEARWLRQAWLEMRALVEATKDLHVLRRFFNISPVV